MSNPKKKSILETLKAELQSYMKDDHLPLKIEVRKGSELERSLGDSVLIEGIPIEIVPDDGQDYTFVYGPCQKPLVQFKHLNLRDQGKVKEEFTHGYRTPEYVSTRP